MEIAAEKNDLYQLVKKAVPDVIREEYATLYLNFLDYLSDKEMSDIINIHGKPDEKNICHSEMIEI